MVGFLYILLVFSVACAGESERERGGDSLVATGIEETYDIALQNSFLFLLFFFFLFITSIDGGGVESAYFNNFLLEYAPRRYHWKESRTSAEVLSLLSRAGIAWPHIAALSCWASARRR